MGKEAISNPNNKVNSNMYNRLKMGIARISHGCGHSRAFHGHFFPLPAGTSSATLGANTEVAVTMAQMASGPPCWLTTSSMLCVSEMKM